MNRQESINTQEEISPMPSERNDLHKKKTVQLNENVQHMGPGSINPKRPTKQKQNFIDDNIGENDDFEDFE